MKYFLLITAVLVAVSAFPYEIVTDEEGQQYHLIPVQRSKRQTTNWQVRSPGIGTISHTGTILNNDNHRLDGTGYAVKDFRRGGIVPDAYGGQLDYAHKPSGGVLSVGADHVRRGDIGTLSYTGTILNNDNHRLDGKGYAVKDFRSGGIAPDAYGGQLDYAHKPSGGVLSVGADHVRQGGTDVKASATYNFINTKNAEVGLSGQYGRHFGGPGGTGKADYGVLLGGKIKF